MSDDKPRNLDDARLKEFEDRAMENISQEDIAELIQKTIAETTPEERLEVLAWSAAAVGAQAALIHIETQRREQGMTSAQSEMLDGIRRQLDDAIIEASDHPVALTLAKIRDPIAAFDKAYRQRSVDACIHMFCAQTGLTPNYLTTPDDDDSKLSTFRAQSIAILEAAREPQHFFGWITKHLRPQLSCECTVCLSNDLRVWDIPEGLDIEAISNEKYGGEASTYETFGRYLHEMWLTRYRQLVKAAEEDAGVNPAAASEIAHGMFSRLLSGKPHVE